MSENETPSPGALRFVLLAVMALAGFIAGGAVEGCAHIEPAARAVEAGAKACADKPQDEQAECIQDFMNRALEYAADPTLCPAGGAAETPTTETGDTDGTEQDGSTGAPPEEGEGLREGDSGA